MIPRQVDMLYMYVYSFTAWQVTYTDNEVASEHAVVNAKCCGCAICSQVIGSVSDLALVSSHLMSEVKLTCQLHKF